MIRHHVFIRFRESVTDAEIDRLLDEVSGLGALLPGIAAIHVGANSSPEVGMDKGFARGFIVDFESARYRDGYLDDDRHRAVGAKLVAAADGGTDGIFVYDLEV